MWRPGHAPRTGHLSVMARAPLLRERVRSRFNGMVHRRMRRLLLEILDRIGSLFRLARLSVFAVLHGLATETRIGHRAARETQKQVHTANCQTQNGLGVLQEG